MNLQSQLDLAGATAIRQNKNITVRAAEVVIPFDKPLRVPSHVSLVSAGEGIRPTVLFYVGKQTSVPLISLEGNQSYGRSFGGFDLQIQDSTLPNMTALRSTGNINSTIRDFRFSHYGVDCWGIVINDIESTTVEKVDVHCASPLSIWSGDNHAFRDMDLGASTDDRVINQQLPAACVWIAGMPYHWIFDGSQTWQGGQHAIYGRVTSPNTGSGLFLHHVRYEQSTSSTDPHRAAVDLRFLEKQLECLLIGPGCRFTDRVKAVDARGIWRVEISESTWIKGSIDTMLAIEAIDTY